MKSFIIVAMSLIAFQSFALTESECTTVNILNGPLATAEVRAHFATPFNQYGSQLCYAHAASDMLSFITGRSISPVAMAILTAGRDFSPDNAGEIPEVLMHASDQHSACTNAGYNSRMTEAQYERLPSRVNCTAANQAQVSGPIKVKFYRDCLSGQIPRRELPDTYKDIILNAVYEEISNHGYPVGLTIYSTLLDPLKPGQTAELGNAHAITVIGRKWNTQHQTCDLVIRNSYGNEPCGDWDQNKEGLTCDSTAIGSGFPGSGVFAMSEALFKRVLHRVTILNHDANATEDVVTVTPPNLCRPDPNARQPASIRQPASLKK